MQHSFHQLRAAYQTAIYLSALYVLDIVRVVRTHRQELWLVRGFNSFLLLLPICLWVMALFNRNWLLLMPLSIFFIGLLLYIFLTPETPIESPTEATLSLYENSSAWLQLKEYALRRDKFRCTVCRSKEQLRVERLSDRHPCHERLYELITICDYCYHHSTKGFVRHWNRKKS